jgi:hypothetical protein
MTIIKLGDDADNADEVQANAAKKEISENDKDKRSASDVVPKEQPSNASAPPPPPSPASPPSPPEKIALRAIHRFTLPYRNGVHTFEKDQIIVDPLIVKFMLQSNCPVVKIEEKIDYQVCPKCFHHF